MGDDEGKREERLVRIDNRPVGKYWWIEWPNRYFGRRISKIEQENDGIELANEREEEEGAMPIEIDIGIPLSKRVAKSQKKRRVRTTQKQKEGGGGALLWEFEMDLGGKPTRRNMPKSSLGNTEGSHLLVFRGCEKRGDVKLRWGYQVMTISNVIIGGRWNFTSDWSGDLWSLPYTIMESAESSLVRGKAATNI